MTVAPRTDLLDAALKYARDWYVFPVDREKHPLTDHGFKDASQNEQQIRRWWREHPNVNIGIACGASGIVVVDLDLDVEKGLDGPAEWAKLTAGHDPIRTAEASTPRGGRHLYFTVPDQCEIRNSASKLAKGIDVRGIGGYIVVPPSSTSDGVYEWTTRPEEGIANLPGWLCERLIKPERPPTPPPGPEREDRDLGPYIAAAVAAEVEAVRAAVDGTRNTTLNTSAFSLAGLIEHGLPEDRILSELLAAAVSAGLSEREARLTIASGIEAGRKNPRTNPEYRMEGKTAPNAGEGAITGTLDEIKATRLTELASAHRLKQHHGRDLRHASGRGWLHWDGKRWEPSDKGVERLAHDIGRHVRGETVGIKDPDIAKAYFQHAKSIERAEGIRSILSIAKSLDGIDADHIEFDSDPWSLNCENGTIDLKTGELRPHRREDYITKIVPVEYDLAATCPRWKRFLHEIYEGDADLIPYVEWLVGYSITGLTTHDLFGIFHGTGANGKTTLLSTTQRIFGDGYSQQLDPEDLLQQKYGRHSTGIAQLRGARLVISQETGESRRLNEPLIKGLTGGDKVRARLICQDSFEFFPTLKLILCTNHKPIIRDTSAGLWRRVRLIPFNRSFTGDDRDPNLRENLWAERRGILTWAVRAASRTAVEPTLPDKVKVATEGYRVEQDILVAFLSECCELTPHGTVEKGVLYRRYDAWTGGKCESQRAFGDRIRARGFDEYRGHGGSRQWLGISLTCNDLQQQGDAG